MNLKQYVNSLLASTPVLSIILSFLFWLRAYIYLGYAPTYSNPDPKSLDMNWLLASIFVFTFLSIVSFPILLVQYKSIRKQILTLYFLSLSILALLAQTNFLDIYNWLLD